MKLIVNNLHIAGGHAGSCNACPIALAMKQAIPGAMQVWVDTEEVRVILRVRPEYLDEIIFPLPKEAQDFIHHFDFNGDAPPAEFDLIP